MIYSNLFSNLFTFIVIFVGILICWIAYKNDTLYFKNYLNYWYKSFDFKGTINRKDYWITQAWCLVFLIFLILTGLSFFYDVAGSWETQEKCYEWSGRRDCYTDIKYLFIGFKLEDLTSSILVPFYSWVILSFVPSLSIQIRRLRDTARNPLWILTSLIPFLGGILLLIFYLSPSKKRIIKNKIQDKLEDKLKEVENLLTKGTIDEEEYKYMRKKILSKHID